MVGVERRLGLVRRVADGLDDLGEGLPRLREVAGPDLQLAQPVEQGRRPALLLGGPPPKPRQQRLHRPPLVLAADGTAVPRTHLAPRHAGLREVRKHLLQQRADLAGVGEMQSAQPLQLGLQVQHRPVRLDRDGGRLHHRRLNPVQLLENGVELSAERGQRLAHLAERPGLRRRQLPQAVEEEAVGQFVVGLDLAAEEVAEGRGQQRRPGRRRRPQQPGQVRVALGQGVGDPSHGPSRFLDQPLRVGVPFEACRLPGDVRGRSSCCGQHSRLAEAFEFVQAIAAEVGGGAVEGDGVARQEELDLLADAFVVAGGEEDLHAVEEAVAGQGDAEGLPGPVVGLVRRLRQRAAVVAEPLFDGRDDLDGTVGEVADHLPLLLRIATARIVPCPVCSRSRLAWTLLLLTPAALLSLAALRGADPPKDQRTPRTPPSRRPPPSTTASQSVTLDNGLHVYLKPVPGSPAVTTMVAYKVGSSDENLDSTGLSHYLEHLMFKGTDKIKPGDIDRLTFRNGGANNAYTDTDYTIFHFDFPYDRWEAALEVEADRMRNLHIDDKHEFSEEKGAVCNELKRDEDEPWDLEHKAIVPLLFGKTGPYGHPVIGLEEQVRAATAEIIKGHYDKWYHPNNASLVVCGGFDPDKALAKIKELFGPIPKAELPERKPLSKETAEAAGAAGHGLQVRRAAPGVRLEHRGQQERRLPGHERGRGAAQRPDQPAVQEAGRGRAGGRGGRRQP